jgi:hypothetical protein
MFAAAIPICGAVGVNRFKKASRIAIRIYLDSNVNFVDVEYVRKAYVELKANSTKKRLIFLTRGTKLQ